MTKKHNHIKKALAVTAGIAASAATAYYLNGKTPTSVVSFHESTPDIYTSSLNNAIMGTSDWNYR
jgi:hypothetical protein